MNPIWIFMLCLLGMLALMGVFCLIGRGLYKLSAWLDEHTRLKRNAYSLVPMAFAALAASAAITWVITAAQRGASAGR